LAAMMSGDSGHMWMKATRVHMVSEPLIHSRGPWRPYTRTRFPTYGAPHELPDTGN
jgi:hypothetical protein